MLTIVEDLTADIMHKNFRYLCTDQPDWLFTREHQMPAIISVICFFFFFLTIIIIIFLIVTSGDFFFFFPRNKQDKPIFIPDNLQTALLNDMRKVNLTKHPTGIYAIVITNNIGLLLIK